MTCLYTNSHINKKSYQENIKVEWDNIKNDFLFRLPSICYKMPFCNNEFEKKEKFNTLSLYKNLSYVYNIINPKIILEWSELLEKILTQINPSKTIMKILIKIKATTIGKIILIIILITKKKI